MICEARARTLLLSDGHKFHPKHSVVRLPFPRHRVGVIDEFYPCLVMVDDRGDLWSPPICHRMHGGEVCVGDEALEMITEGRMTPEEALWNTAFLDPRTAFLDPRTIGLYSPGAKRIIRHFERWAAGDASAAFYERIPFWAGGD